MVAKIMFITFPCLEYIANITQKQPKCKYHHNGLSDKQNVSNRAIGKSTGYKMVQPLMEVKGCTGFIYKVSGKGDRLDKQEAV